MPSQSPTLDLIVRALMKQDRRHAAVHGDAIAEASFNALNTVERALSQARVTHPIPLLATREALEEVLPLEEARGHNTVGARLVRLQLRLLDAGRAKPNGSDLDFEIFRGILGQHDIEV